jgi:hypothetical protein
MIVERCEKRKKGERERQGHCQVIEVLLHVENQAKLQDDSSSLFSSSSPSATSISFLMQKDATFVHARSEESSLQIFEIIKLSDFAGDFNIDFYYHIAHT